MAQNSINNTIIGNASISGGTVDIAATGIVEINSSGGTLNIGNDAVAQAINIGTGAAARTITLGNTTGATAFNIDFGTGDFTVDSATGNIITATDTGEITTPLQPCFLARSSATDTNVTGDGTAVDPVVFGAEIFDQNSDYDTSTNLFTAPVTGRYFFRSSLLLGDLTASHTNMDQRFITSNRTYRTFTLSPGAMRNSGNQLLLDMTAIADMDAADTCKVALNISNGTLVVDIVSTGVTDVRTSFAGELLS